MRLSVLGVAVATLGVSASSAHAANDVDVGRVAIAATDTTPPTFAVGGYRSPAGGTIINKVDYSLLDLDIRATDSGSGLKEAQAFIDGVPTGPPVAFDPAGCDEPAPGGQCPMVGSAEVIIDTKNYPDNNYTLEVRVTDWAGNVGTDSKPLQILNNVDLGSPTQTLSIGTSGIVVPDPNAAPRPDQGGVQGAQSAACRSPRLSVSLDSKPLRMSNRVPVLLAKKSYRFEGRLSCVVNGKRRSAPKRTRIEVLNKVGKKTVSKPATRLRNSGRLNAVIKTPNAAGTRTLIFRYRNSSGQRAQVQIKVKVEKKKSTRR